MSEEQIESSSSTRLVDRLRGIYEVPVNDGAGLLNGADTFTSKFNVPPINLEAANRIEELEDQLDVMIGACRILSEDKVRLLAILRNVQDALDQGDVGEPDDYEESL